ncbi:FtsX-like permease family protein [Sandarakinorhabdus sp.]|uniref:FtsX-like permease family protein n=1 Tax=Sandarakinorhabdus sp. TaxID=1916663 RepID=UPI00286D7116|nr:FtsX-like permease family protein [Sandarakinorhabdus sp.]
MTSPARLGATSARWLIIGEWRAHPARAMVAVLAIAIGVALGLAVHLVNTAALDSFARAISTVSGSADLRVHSVTPAGFDEAFYPRLARIPGIAALSPVVELAATSGQIARPGQRQGAGQANGTRLTLLGIDALQALKVTPALLGMPLGGAGAGAGFDPDSIFVSRAVLSLLGKKPGDVIDLAAAGHSRRFVIAGVLAAADDGQRLAVIDIADAQWRFGQLGRLQRLDLKLADGADRDAVIRRIAALLPPGVELGSADHEGARADALSRAYRVNLGMLALVALLTGGFLVYSAQSLSVARRRPQFALLRVLGLPARGLVSQVVVEGLIVGLAGAALGLLLGHGLADLAINRFGGDLGGGYFSGARSRLAWSPLAMAGFGSLGLAVAVIGSLVPALSAARAQPAAALKGTGETIDPRSRPQPLPALVLLALGGLAALLPPVFELPLFGYAAMALLLAGGVALMPALAQLLLAPLARRALRPVAADLAVRRLWGAPSQASVALCGIVASTSLMVAMAVMVASFRTSVDNWLVAALPSDVYLHLEGTDAGGIDRAAQARLASVSGVANISFVRNMPLRLHAERPSVQLSAQTLVNGQPDLPLLSSAPVPLGTVRVWISEPMGWLYGLSPGMRFQLPLGARNVPVVVAGVWRDYARQFGSVVIGRDDYARLTGDSSASEAAITLAPRAQVQPVIAALKAALPPGLAGQALFGQPAEMRAMALTIFDRSFAVTYALEGIAILIGLMGVAATFSAQTLARVRELAMLRHIGVTRRQLLAMLAFEGAGLGLVGAIAGLGLGLVMAQVLIHVVNPQSFHWTMDTSLPFEMLGLLVVALVAAAAGTAALAGRRALSGDMLRSVRDDW